MPSLHGDEPDQFYAEAHSAHAGARSRIGPRVAR